MEFTRSTPSLKNLDIHFNKDGWGPVSGDKSLFFFGVPYANFDKKDKIGRPADFAAQGSSNYLRQHKRREEHGTPDLSYRFDAVEDSTFQLVDTAKTGSKMKTGTRAKSGPPPFLAGCCPFYLLRDFLLSPFMQASLLLFFAAMQHCPLCFFPRSVVAGSSEIPDNPSPFFCSFSLYVCGRSEAPGQPNAAGPWRQRWLPCIARPIRAERRYVPQSCSRQLHEGKAGIPRKETGPQDGPHSVLDRWRRLGCRRGD